MVRYIVRRLLWVHRAPLRRERAHVRDLLRAAVGPTPRAARGPRAEPAADRGDPPHARARPTRARAVLALHEERCRRTSTSGTASRTTPTCRTRSSTACRPRSRWRSAAVIVWLVVGFPVGIISRDPATQPCSTALAMGARWWRSRRPCTGSAWSRSTSSPTTSGSIQIFPGVGSYVPISRGPGQVVHVADPALARAGRRVRGDLRAAAARQPDRDDVARTTSARRAPRACRERRGRSCATGCARRSRRSSRSLGLDIGILLGGAILTETVFNIPGIGRLAYDAIQNARPADRSRARCCSARSSSSSRTSSWTSPTRSSTRGCRLLSVTRRCSRSRTCASHFATEDGVVKAVDGISLRGRRAAGARDRRRVRLGQERLLADRDGPDARPHDAQISGDDRCSRAATCSTPPTTSCARSAATTSR